MRPGDFTTCEGRFHCVTSSKFPSKLHASPVEITPKCCSHSCIFLSRQYSVYFDPEVWLWAMTPGFSPPCHCQVGVFASYICASGFYTVLTFPLARDFCFNQQITSSEILLRLPSVFLDLCFLLKGHLQRFASPLYFWNDFYFFLLDSVCLFNRYRVVYQGFNIAQCSFQQALGQENISDHHIHSHWTLCSTNSDPSRMSENQELAKC